MSPAAPRDDSNQTVPAAILDALPANVALLDARGTVVVVNAAWSRFAAANDCEPDKAGPGVNYLKICDEATGPFAQQAAEVGRGIRAVLAGAVTEFALEYPCHSADERRWFRVMVTPLRAAAGKVGPSQDGVVVTHVNVTERRLAEEALRTSEAHYRLVFESNPQPMWVFDRDTLAFLAVNHAAEVHYGYTREEFLRLTLADIRPPEDVPLLHRQIARIHEGIFAPDTVVRHRRKDGAVRMVEVSVSALPDTDRRTAMASVQDVTDRLRAAEALAASEDNFRRAFSDAATGIAITDLAGRFVEANTAYCRMLGYAEEELRQQHSPALTHPLDRARNQALLEEIVSGRRESFVLEKRYLAKGGRVVWARLSASTQRDATGRACRIIGVVEDLTAAKAIEAQQHRDASLMRLAGRLAGVGGWALTVPERTLYCSQQVAEMLGLPSDGTAGVDQMLARLSEPARARMLAALDMCMAKAVPFELDVEFAVASDRRCWIRVGGEADLDDEGRVRAVHGAIGDITDRRRSELALRQAAERLETTLASITDAFLTMDRDWRFTYLNREAERLLLRSKSELLGRIIWEAYPDIVGGGIERAYRRAMEERVTVGLEEFYPPLGCWFEIRAYPSVEGVAVYFRDISQRRANEQQLRLLQTCIDRINDVVIITEAAPIDDPGPAILYVNEAFVRRTGQSRDEVMDRGPRLLQAPQTLAANRARIREALAQGHTLREVVVNRSASGVSSWSELDLVPVTDAAGVRTHWVAIERDITERREAELKLQQSEERFRELADNIGDAFYSYSPAENRLLYANASYSRIWGRTLETLYENRLTYLDGIHPEDRPRAEAALREQLLGRQTDEEFRVVRPDGDFRWVHEHSVPILNAEGKVARIVGTMRDITAAKLAEEQLRESDARFRELAENILDVFYNRDPVHDRMLYVSPAFEEVWGRPTAELYAQPRAYLEGIHPDDRHLAIAARDEHVAGRQTVLVYRVVRPDGEVRWVRDHSIPVTDEQGAVVRVVGSARDVTERRQAEERLAEQAALLDAAHEAILVKELDDRIVYWNKGAERIYGWTAAEAVGRTSTELFSYRPDPAVRAHLLQHGEWSGELIKRNRQGRELRVESRSTLVRDETGNPKSILLIDVDVTERRKLEEQFLRAQRMESIGTLAGGIAHDLNNLLTPITISVELLRRYASDPRSLQIIDRIEQSARRGANLVGQVLSFARGVEGERVALQVRHLLREIEAIMESTFPKNIEVVTALPADLWPMLGDPTQLHQVFLNLCVNARDAMAGGGRLTLRASNAEIDETFAIMNQDGRPGRYLCIEVSDTGCGIPAETIDRIFDPFFTTKELGQGTGLGLSTAIGIVRSHGGFLNVRSEVGRGSTFAVYLPARDKTEPPATENVVAAAPVADRLPRGNGEWVLVVDDEASILQVTKRTLETFGYRVVTADDGAQAISVYAARQHEVALVLTDMMMPVMDGPALIAALRRMNPRVRVIASSGLAGPGTATSVAGEVRYFLTKPYSTETLLRLIRRALVDEPEGGGTAPLSP